MWQNIVYSNKMANKVQACFFVSKKIRCGLILGKKECTKSWHCKPNTSNIVYLKVSNLGTQFYYEENGILLHHLANNTL